MDPPIEDPPLGIAVDRCMVVLLGIKYRKTVTKRVMLLAISAIWLLSCIVLFPLPVYVLNSTAVL